MKILNIAFESMLSPQGGLGVHVRDCSTELARLGHDITVLGYDALTMEFCDVEFNGYRVINCKNTSIHANPKDGYYLLTLNDMLTENLLYHLKNEKFDIIALHDTVLWPIAKYAAIMFKAPIVTFAHLSHALCHRDYYYTEQKQFEVEQEWHAYMQSHSVCTCSKAYEKEIQDFFMIDRKFEIVYNGVDFEHLQQFVGSPKTITDKPLVGFVGRMVPSKGIGLILAAIKSCPDYYFILISNVAPGIEKFMPLVSEIRKMEETCQNFTWYNDIPTSSDEKWELMASCDLALVPSFHEPWGIISDEWGVLQVPKIITKVGGLTEHNSIDDSIMIEPTADALVRAIKEFKRDPKKVRNAHYWARKQSWANTAKQVEKYYMEVLN